MKATENIRDYIAANGDRFYYFASDPKNQRVSVTSILRVLNKPFLNDYLVREAAKTGSVESSGDAALLGTLAHEVAEELMNATDMDAMLQLYYAKSGYTEACNRARHLIKWRRDKAVVIVGTEMAIINDQYHYAGRIDLVCIIDNKVYFVDFKTSKKIDPSYAIQLEAYSQFDYIYYNGRWVENREFYKMLDVEDNELLILQLMKTKVKEIPVLYREEVWDTFESLVKLKSEWFNDTQAKCLGSVSWEGRYVERKPSSSA